MDVILYKGMAKRSNSTLRPTTAYDVFNCNLLERTSILEPVLCLDLSLVDPVSNSEYTYAEIPLWK